MMVLIDNYDSFTYNIYQQVRTVTDEHVEVIRNDCIDISGLEKINPKRIIISPGPKRPENAGITNEAVKHFHNKIPILGICLGHQAICSVFGEKIVYANELYHGKTSKIKILKECRILKGFNDGFEAARYHSLVIERKAQYDLLEVLAISDDGEIMAVKHKQYETYGVQFHPESILTENGIELFRNFMEVEYV